MKLETLSFQEILKQSPDIFEAVVVLSERTKQIISRRAAELVMEEDDYTEDEYNTAEPTLNEDYEELDKEIVLAMADYRNKELEWRFSSPEEEQLED
ncbi:MAG: hypothetical protein KAU50_02485 [Candidatus Marinimicrobia bacterium]|nr:hypothetical protein [Candidatus Neomarinimicrobiota bacterium]